MDSVTKAIINALRRISYLNVHRKETTAKAHVSRGQYKCESCNQLYKRKEIHMDHIEPVVDPHKGFDGDWNKYIKNLFYGKLQALCVDCHKSKTKAENEIRKQTRDWEAIK